MKKLFENFPKSDKQEWIALLAKELKGGDPDMELRKFNQIEGFDYLSYFH